MKRGPFLLLILLMLWAGTVEAQVREGREVRYDLVFRQKKLKKVLRYMERRYGLHFSYSPDRIDENMTVDVEVTEATLPETLEALFENLPVGYALLGEQIVLRRRPQPVRDPLPQRRYFPAVGVLPDAIPCIEEPRPSLPQLKFAPPSILAEPEDLNQIVQVTLVPLMGTNGARSPEYTNKLSVNVLAGYHGSLEGTEVGGVNILKDRMHGFQFGLLGNWVEGEMLGTQIGALNLNLQDGSGRQLGLLNWQAGAFTGWQIALGINSTGGRQAGWQVAGLGNIAKDDAWQQAAGLINWCSGKVHRSQASLLLNRARVVEKNQVGLVNLCDSIGGAAFGLVNVVGNGRRSLTVSGSATLHAEWSLQLGTDKFYSLLQLSHRLDEASWSLGYGFGHRFPLGKKAGWTTELLLSHLNEREAWTEELNLLFQLRAPIEVALGPDWSLQFGPVIYWSISRLQEGQGEHRQRGTQIAPWVWWENDREKNTAQKLWAGGRIGLRYAW